MQIINKPKASDVNKVVLKINVLNMILINILLDIDL